MAGILRAGNRYTTPYWSLNLPENPFLCSMGILVTLLALSSQDVDYFFRSI